MSLEVEVVSNASTTNEQSISCLLEKLPEALLESELPNPAIIFIRWPKSKQTVGHLDFYPFSAQHLGVSGSKLAVDC